MAKPFKLRKGWMSRPDLLNTLPKEISNNRGIRIIEQLVSTGRASWYEKKGPKYTFSPKFIEKFNKEIMEIMNVEFAPLPDELIWTLGSDFREFITKPIIFKPITEEKLWDLVETHKLEEKYPDLFQTCRDRLYLHKDLIPILKQLVRDEVEPWRFNLIGTGSDRKLRSEKPSLEIYDRNN